MKAQVIGAEVIFNCIVLSSFRRKLLSEAKKNYRNRELESSNLNKPNGELESSTFYCCIFCRN